MVVVHNRKTSSEMVGFFYVHRFYHAHANMLFRTHAYLMRNNICQREVQVIKNNLKKILNNVFCIGIICIFVYTKQINEMKITKKSSLSGVEHTLDIDITEEQFQRVEMRFFTKEKIQDILPNVSLGEREFLMTGITQEEWDNTFNYIEN